MRKLLIVLAILIPSIAWGQVPSTYVPQLITYQGVPFGRCDVYQIAENVTNGNYYTCNISTKLWQIVTGSTTTISSGQVAFGSGTNTISGDSQWTWDSTNKRMLIGPATSSFATITQGFLDNYNDGTFSYRGIFDNTRITSLSVTGQANPNTFPTRPYLPFQSNGFVVNSGTSAISAINGAALLNENISGTGSITFDGDAVNGDPDLFALGATTLLGSPIHVTNFAGISQRSYFDAAGATAFDAYGILSAITLSQAATVTNIQDFYAADPSVIAGSVVTNNYGFRSRPMASIATNNFAFEADAAGNGAHDWAFYSAGGGSQFNAAVSQTKTVFDVNNADAGNGTSLAVIRGNGLTDSVAGLTLLELKIKSVASGSNLLLTDEAKPAAFTYFSAFDDGTSFIQNGDGGGGNVFIGFNENSAGSTAHNKVGISASAGLELNGPMIATSYTTFTNCAANGTSANPSVVACSSASSGMFSCSATASTGTCQVNTTAVTANSEILITQDSADGGASQLNVTCNTTNVLNTSKPLLVSKSAGASFTINLGTVTANPACFEYHIVN